MVIHKDNVQHVLEILLQTVLEELALNAQMVRLYNKYTTQILEDMKTNANRPHVIQDHTLTHKVYAQDVKTIESHHQLDQDKIDVLSHHAQVKLSIEMAHADHAILVRLQMSNKDHAHKLPVQNGNVVKQMDNALVINATMDNN